MFKVKEGIELFGDAYLKHPTGNYGSVEIDGGNTGGWEGYSIGGRAVFMHDNNNATGLYDDVNNKWLFLGYHGGDSRLYHNGSEKFSTKSYGALISGRADISGGANIVSTASAPFRWQRSGLSQTGQDDNVTVHVDDSNIYFKHNNDSDGDAGSYHFQYTTAGTATNILSIHPAYTWVRNAVHSPIYYDRDNTARFVDPASTSQMYHINMNNGNLTGVNHIIINDPGPSEGISWNGGNGWKIHESPNDMTTNSSGNLQFGRGTTRDFTVETSGYVHARKGIEFGNNAGLPMVEWGASGNSTGAVRIDFPGTSANYGMVHMVIDVYEYNSMAASTIIIGGHNWNSNWYNYNCRVIGDFNKSVRLAYYNGKYCVLLGNSGSSWTYGTVILRKVHNGSFYNAKVDTTGFAISQSTLADSSYSALTGDIKKRVLTTDDSTGGGSYVTTNTAQTITGVKTFAANVTSSGNRSATFYAFNGEYVNAGTDVRAPIFYDRADTSYYVNPNGTSRIYDLDVINKRTDFGSSSDWDAINFSRQTNIHFQGHNQFWIGAGNGTWFAGAANAKSQASGLAADASKAHDLLITTMQSTSTYDRGITFAVDNTGSGLSGWRLGKWHSGDARDASMLAIDGMLRVHGAYTDEYDYYANDYSAYYSKGQSYWAGDTNAGWHRPSATFSSAIQIQSGNRSTNSRKPQIQFHQYGYGGPGIEYDGPNKKFTFGELGTSNPDRVNTFEFRFDNTIRARINSDYMFHNSDIRSPIFYDSDNTAFYCNPTGTSVFNALTVNSINNYSTNQFMRRIAKANATVGPGWITVAENTSGRKHGEVIVTDADSGDHGFIRIDWMRSYADNNFTVLNCGGHSNRITGARVLYQTSDVTYGNCKLQVYVNTSSNYEVNIYEHGDIDDYRSHQVVTPVVQNSISGYAIHGNELAELDHYGFAAEEGIRAGGKLKVDDRVDIAGKVNIGGATEHTSSDSNGVVYGNPTANKLFVNGSIQLNGNSDAIVFGRSSASFLKDEELAFGWGGGLYMQDGTYLRIRGNKSVYSTGDARFSIYYDSANTNYYCDPAGTSSLFKIWVKGSSANVAPRWDTSFHVVQSQHWYGHTASSTMYLGESGNKTRLRGTLNVGSDADSPSGYRASIHGSLHMNNSQINYVQQLHFNDNVRFYDDGNDNYLNFKWGDTGAGGIKFYDGNSTIHGYIYGDGGGKFGLLDNDGAWAVRIQTGTSPLELRCNNNVEFYVYDSYTYSPGSSRAPIFYDSDDTGYYTNPASTSNMMHITMHGDLVVPGDHRNRGVFGTYDSYKTQHIWSMGTAYRNHASGSNFGNLYGLAYKHTNNGTGGSMAGGHMMVWCQNGTTYAAMGSNIWTRGNVTAYSDARVKTNVEVIPNAVDKVSKLNGYTFDRTDVECDENGQPLSPVRQTGVIAQEVLEVLPEAVTGGPTEEDPDGHYSVAYGNLAGLLIEAIKEQQQQIEDLKSEIESLKM